MKLWIGNIAPGTPGDESREFVKKYAADLGCVNIQRIDGDGSRPGVIEKISTHLNGMHRKGRALLVSPQGG